MFLIGGISKTKNYMEMVRIIPEKENLDSTIENFRNSVLALDVKDSTNISVFLVSLEKFELVWDAVFQDREEEDELLNETKQRWTNLIKQKRVLVIEDNIKNLVDIL